MENTETVAAPEIKYINFEVEKNGKKFVFCIPDGSLIGDSYDAAYQVLQRLCVIANEAALNMARPDSATVVAGEPAPQGENNAVE